MALGSGESGTGTIKAHSLGATEIRLAPCCVPPPGAAASLMGTGEAVNDYPSFGRAGGYTQDGVPIRSSIHTLEPGS